jgi:hypothetical protein
VGDLIRLVEKADRIHSGPWGWVLKGEFGAAGRERLSGAGDADLDPAVLEAAARMFRRNGKCLFEPWLRRISDFGCSLLIGGDQARLAGVHRLLVSSAGRFQGVETSFHGLAAPGPIGPGPFEEYLTAGEAARMAGVAAGTAAALRRAGYRGHVGIDFFRHLDSEGGERLHPLGEINARLTFGLVAAVLAQRVGTALGTEPGTRFLLSFEQENLGLKGRRLGLVEDRETGSPVVTLFVS